MARVVKRDGPLLVALRAEGAVIIPKSLREQLGLRAGDLLEVEARGSEIVLRPRPVGRVILQGVKAATQDGLGGIVRLGGDAVKDKKALHVHHQTAEARHARFRARDATYLYLDCVANEVVTVLARRAVARKLDPRPWTGPEWPRLWDRVLDTLVEHRGRLSFHDCVLVLVCREGGIEWVASFDRGFDDIEGVRRVDDPTAVLPGWSGR